MQRHKNPESGFTLMEILVALLLFAIMAAGFSRYITGRAQQTAYLTDKTLAAIVASNALSEMQADGRWPQTGHTTGQVMMASKTWQVSMDVQDTDRPMLRRVDVTVSLPAAADAPPAEALLTLTGFAGQH